MKVAVDQGKSLPKYVVDKKSSHGFKEKLDEHLERRLTASYHSWLQKTLKFNTGSSGVYQWGVTQAFVLLLFMPRQPPMVRHRPVGRQMWLKPSLDKKPESPCSILPSSYTSVWDFPMAACTCCGAHGQLSEGPQH